MRKIKWGVLGTAGIAKGQTIPGMVLAENCELTAIAGRNMEKALEYQKALNYRVETLVSVGIFPATKYACTLRGIDCGACRRPFDPLSEEAKETVRKLMELPYPEGV